MKKLLLLATALLTLSTAHAELILHESFDRPVGNLNVGNTPAANNTDWYSFSGTSNYISVVEGSLSYEGYAEAAGKKVELVGNGADDLRQFAPITSGKVYVAAIINVDSLKQFSSTASGTITANGDYFLAMGDASNSKMYARSVKEEGAETYTKIQLGIAKYSEQSTSTTTVIPMVDVAMKQNILVVLEYEFVAGDKNDVARLYVNPTKETTTATLVCGLDVSTSAGSAIGANSKDDASKIASVNLRKGTNTPGRVYVDEIKVATAWENLFAGESGETPVEEPEITATPAILQFGGQVFVGSTYTTKFVVKGKNLNGDITLTSSNAELTLDKTTISKADAESTDGAEVIATLSPATATYAMETVTLTSKDAADVVLNASWYAVEAVTCNTLAELKAEAAKVSGWEIYVRYTGEAIVTYAVTEEITGYTYNLKYIEDNTAAIRVSDVYWTNVKQGDKITGFVLEARDPDENTVSIVTAFGADATILSSENDVTPQVVTLADLKNNADDYLYELVKVEGVTFADNENWKSGAQIKQGENTAVVNLISGNELINTPKPAKADIIGISKSTTGAVLCVRGKQDVVAAPTAIENIAADSEVEIYTVSGMRVSELQPGVNIIRQGNKTFKVVR